MIASLFNAVLLAVMEAVFQGALYGVVGKFPPEYIGAVVQGKIKLIQSKMYAHRLVIRYMYLNVEIIEFAGNVVTKIL